MSETENNRIKERIMKFKQSKQRKNSPKKAASPKKHSPKKDIFKVDEI